MKGLLSVISALLLVIGMVSAHEHDFSETKKLIDSRTSCDKLTDRQFESIGDYYMEQMHPGEAHEKMDNMMGGEGSESLKQMHTVMAKRMYCNEEGDGMMGMMSNKMMGSGSMMDMMNMVGGNMMQNNMQGTMGCGYGYWGFLNILYVLLLIGLVTLVYLLIMKLWKSMQGTKK